MRVKMSDSLQRDPRVHKDCTSCQACDSQAVYDLLNAVVLLSEKEKECDSLLISGNHTSGVDGSEKRLPIIIKESYYKTKGGVDLLDASVEAHIVRRKTVRWPLLLFLPASM